MSDIDEPWQLDTCPICISDVHALATTCPSCGATRRKRGATWVSYRSGRRSDIVAAAVFLFVAYFLVIFVLLTLIEIS